MEVLESLSTAELAAYHALLTGRYGPIFRQYGWFSTMPAEGDPNGWKRVYTGQEIAEAFIAGPNLVALSHRQKWGSGSSCCWFWFGLGDCGEWDNYDLTMRRYFYIWTERRAERQAVMFATLRQELWHPGACGNSAHKLYTFDDSDWADIRTSGDESQLREQLISTFPLSALLATDIRSDTPIGSITPFVPPGSAGENPVRKIEDKFEKGKTGYSFAHWATLTDGNTGGPITFLAERGLYQI